MKTGAQSKIGILVLAVILVGFGFGFGYLSMLRYWGYHDAMMDIGQISQAIWSITQGEPMMMTWFEGQISRLSWHLELIYYPIALFYRLFPRPETLLAVQVIMVVLGGLPLYQLARRYVKDIGLSLLVVLTYLVSLPLVSSTLFDFHGDTLAIPFLLFAINAADQKKWLRYGLWIVVALSCKVYVALPVAVLGGVLFLQGERKVGFVTMLCAGIWGGGAFFVLRPLLATKLNTAVALSGGSYLERMFNPEEWEAFHIVSRILAIAFVFFPIILLGRRAKLWLLPAFAVALPVALSSVYHYYYHHYALAIPFVFMALVVGAGRYPRSAKLSNGQVPLAGHMGVIFSLTLIFTLLFSTTPFNLLLLRFDREMRWEVNGYNINARDELKDKWLAEYVPADVPLMVTSTLAPHLSNRKELYAILEDRALVEKNLQQVDYVVLDVFFELLGGANMTFEKAALDAVAQDNAFSLQTSRDGLVLFERTTEGLVSWVEVRPMQETPVSPMVSFGDEIGLLDYEVEPLGNRHYLLHYEWIALQDLSEMPGFFAISSLEPDFQSRFFHIPTWSQYPTGAWQIGEVIVEEIEIVIPGEVPGGTYPLFVNWYDASNPVVARTDEESWIREPYLVTEIQAR